MTRAAFERLVAEAIRLIPKRFRREMKNLAIVVEDEPSAELLEEMEIEPPDSLYGLHQGTPLPERTGRSATACPIASRSFEADRRGLRRRGRHPRGHRRDGDPRSRALLRLSEEEIEEIEERYWRGGALFC